MSDMSEVLDLPPPAQAESAGPAGHGRASASEARQFVTFRVGDEVFAVPMAPVREIIRVPDLIRVPLAPPLAERPGQSARHRAADRRPA